ncbi:MAG: FUN14 domain-containing protein [Candidatus Riflebacteria bacterium]|nr:FUN14 domain-containing protein [Candidatus Riflebacteria bacterium]
MDNFAKKNFFSVLFFIIFLFLLSGTVLTAATTPEKGVQKTDGSSPLDSMPPETKFLITNLGFGGIAGWCVGFTLKKFAKMAALLLGVVFIAIQVLSNYQYLQIDWQKVQKNVPDQALEKAYTSGMSMLTYNFPFAGAFFAGLWLGFRNG